ncbi:MAG: hypothetical protein ACYC4P_19915 [Thermoanaerobaculia bacterium]
MTAADGPGLAADSIPSLALARLLRAALAALLAGSAILLAG